MGQDAAKAGHHRGDARRFVEAGNDGGALACPISHVGRMARNGIFFKNLLHNALLLCGWREAQRRAWGRRKAPIANKLTRKWRKGQRRDGWPAITELDIPGYFW
jgi:hypothetical protein